MRSVTTLLGLSLDVPDHTTLSRRSAALSLVTALAVPAGPVTVVIDSTGLKVFGAGEWRMAKHGGRDRRTWRKLHLAIDPDTGEVLASALTTTEEGDASLVRPLLDQIAAPIAAVLADGAYDGDPVYRAVADRAPAATVIIPPRASAVVSEVSAAGTPTPRDRHIEMIAAKGRLGWQKAVGYGRRSLVETGMLRHKTIIGRTLRARSLPAQKVEAKANLLCIDLNRTLVNLDFAEVCAIMYEMGTAVIGVGEATGERRALRAAEAAIANRSLMRPRCEALAACSSRSAAARILRSTSWTRPRAGSARRSTTKPTSSWARPSTTPSGCPWPRLASID